MAYDPGHALEVGKGMLVETEKGLELLIPDRFLVSVPGVSQRQTRHPGSFSSPVTKSNAGGP